MTIEHDTNWYKNKTSEPKTIADRLWYVCTCDALERANAEIERLWRVIKKASPQYSESSSALDD